MCSAIAYKMKMPMIHVRKETGHSMKTVEGAYISPDENINYLVIDDLIASGNTVRKVVISTNKEIRYYGKKPNPVAVLLYSNDDCHKQTIYVNSKYIIPIYIIK
jgi:orotate phosphoribosyltransferase